MKFHTLIPVLTNGQYRFITNPSEYSKVGGIVCLQLNSLDEQSSLVSTANIFAAYGIAVIVENNIPYNKKDFETLEKFRFYGAKVGKKENLISKKSVGCYFVSTTAFSENVLVGTELIIEAKFKPVIPAMYKPEDFAHITSCQSFINSPFPNVSTEIKPGADIERYFYLCRNMFVYDRTLEETIELRHTLEGIYNKQRHQW